MFPVTSRCKSLDVRTNILLVILLLIVIIVVIMTIVKKCNSNDNNNTCRIHVAACVSAGPDTTPIRLPKPCAQPGRFRMISISYTGDILG